MFAGSERSPLNTIRKLCDKEEWITACEELSRSEACRVFVESVAKQPEACTVARRRTRSLSNVTEKASDRCVELTSNMDLSTKELAEEKLVLIVKELRGVKKRLGQIAKLEESNGSSLSEEQQEKVARRPQLEADLRLFEPALAKVEKRIKVFSEEIEQETKPVEETTVTQKMEEDPKPEDNSETKVLRCDVCGITCPNDSSYTMHMNGRKHRNKIAQAKEDEETKIAAEMMAERNKQLMLGMQQTSSKPVKVAWHKPTSSAPKLPCKLPPPPHGTPDTLAPTPSLKSPSAKPTLKEIMDEESRSKATPKKPSSKKVLALKATPPTITASPFVLPVGSAPPLKSPPWASPSANAVPIQRSHAAAAPSTSPKPARDGASFSLGDFMTKPKPGSLSRPGAAVWASPSSSRQPVASPTPKKNGVSFADIQQEELASKETEIQTLQSPSGETNKWFIHRRERTGSLLEIQDEANKERENQIFIEEQYRIEKMIAEENARREKEDAKQQRKSKPKNKKKKPSGDKKEGPTSQRQAPSDEKTGNAVKKTREKKKRPPRENPDKKKKPAKEVTSTVDSQP